jgi:hypothetical protein
MSINKELQNELDMDLLTAKVEIRRGINEKELCEMLDMEAPRNMSAWLALDRLLLEAEVSVGLMDGFPLWGV